MRTNSKPILKWAAPVLASLDIERTLKFYCSRLGFTRVYEDAGVWGIVSRDDVYIHFGRARISTLPKTRVVAFM